MIVFHVNESDNSTIPAKYGIMLDFVLDTNMHCNILFLIGLATGIIFMIKHQALDLNPRH